MNAQNENQDTAQTVAYNPFPEPQTIPSGWDTSELLFTPQPTSVEQPDDSRESDAS